MSVLPDIFHTQIVSDKYDIFWTNSSGSIDKLSPKSILVVSSSFNSGSEEEIQLKKMLGACKLQEEDYNIIQLNAPVAWHLLRDQLSISTILLLGITQDQLGVSVHLMPHQVGRFNNVNWIVTSSLTDLLTQNDIKKHLWDYGLKPVFVDKIYG